MGGKVIVDVQRCAADDGLRSRMGDVQHATWPSKHADTSEIELLEMIDQGLEILASQIVDARLGLPGTTGDIRQRKTERLEDFWRC
jgi:hypothetical protein